MIVGVQWGHVLATASQERRRGRAEAVRAVDEVFLCQSEALKVVEPALRAIFAEGARPTLYFRDIKAQIEQAAGSCGIEPARVFK